MFSTTLIIITSVIGIGVSAVDESCVTPSNTDPIENCCDLGFRQTEFSEVVNKPKVYKFKNFCKNFRSSPTSGYCDTITDGGGWLVIQRRMDAQKTFTGTGLITRKDLEALQVNYGMAFMLFTAWLVVEIGNCELTLHSVMELNHLCIIIISEWDQQLTTID